MDMIIEIEYIDGSYEPSINIIGPFAVSGISDFELKETLDEAVEAIRIVLKNIDFSYRIVGFCSSANKEQRRVLNIADIEIFAKGDFGKINGFQK
ncbi:hypothetical protein RRV45_19730 [Bacillus sp. DTU_2020_1000418_1_SI_GHA_SEK_038]|uniref:hypothetical protein n=1 Tax=Bacillus sp. DTU_2020_1000418_1_SI_GHA_SEK_038 TaxID=3077585 RepID=UPI0028E2EC84|nr:hypothetical protein [Bacillus sp. DTU_2020_1000418_1_SI_GHA_SEK_038]WNS75083.1 hypothetical protein RRV45_19730 [Bacillus sp. DTU_2020_1000418_1_SI_GHA_SEK_038]